MLALVGVHIAAVCSASWLHHENLMRRDDQRAQGGAPKTACAAPGAAWPC